MPVTRTQRRTIIEQEPESSSDVELLLDKLPSVNSKSKPETKKSKKNDVAKSRRTRSNFTIQNESLTESKLQNEPDQSNLPLTEILPSNNIESTDLNVINPTKKSKRGRKSKKQLNASEVSSTNTSNIMEPIEEVPEIKKRDSPKRKNKRNKKTPPKNRQSAEEMKSLLQTTGTPIKRENTYIISDDPSSTEDTCRVKKLTFGEAGPCRLFKPSNEPFIMKTPPKTLCCPVSVGSAGKTPRPPFNKFEDKIEEEKLSSVRRSIDNNANNQEKKKVFAAASPCRLFRSITADKMKTPPKAICRTVSFGSAGRTPRPPPEKNINETKMSTPKSNAVILNLTHSIEKGVCNENKEKSLVHNRVRFTSPVFKNNLKKDVAKITKIPLKISSTTLRGKISKIGKPSATEIDRKRTRGITKASKKSAPVFSEAKSKKIADMIRSSAISTPSHTLVKPVQPISRSKMPDFASLHKRQFAQMESLHQNKERREERAKKLLFTATPKSQLDDKKKEKRTMGKDQANASGFGAMSISDSFRFLPNVSYQDSPKTKLNISKVKEETQKKSTRIAATRKKEEYRNHIVGVRTNRRFELQMKARNIT